ncbi:hypothetical protein [uncultured Robinsoniella sp.]|uniref:hypothetical protein n=1 Tax=uncultured Robinsoniella sp. TaxID=904190 RepID=UPI002907924E|nr:hypothetical protein [Clostridiales bacterium]
MSDLRPKGTPISICGVERHICFNLNVTDEIQEHYDMSMYDVLDMLTNKRTASSTMKYILTVLFNDEAERTENEELKVTVKEVGWMVTEDNVDEIMTKLISTYGISLPKIDEYENPKVESGTVTEE